MFKTIIGVMQVPMETHILLVGVNNQIKIHTEAKGYNSLHAIPIQVIRVGEYKLHNNLTRIHTEAREYNSLHAIQIQVSRAGEYKLHNQPRIPTEAREYKILHAMQFQTIKVGVSNLLMNKEIRGRSGQSKALNPITDSRDHREQECLQVLLHKDLRRL